ncbi:MAG: ATP-binding protein, partial [Deltaproteobacteria bacterium]|nr:ATP-binding protein [Deltaproteobacteria bacterium]
ELIQNSPHWNKNIKIFTETNPHTIIESDPDQIRQVLWNLFINAVDAMETGGELHIETSPEKLQWEKEEEGIRIVIRDTGRGFDEDGVAHLFMPFFTTKKAGSGLGLAIVKRIMDRLHGKIYGRNHPEGGAEISILLPVRMNPSEP